MIDKLIYLLQELKDNFSKEKMDETLECLEDEVTPDALYTKQDEFREAFNGQHKEFYNELAINIVADLNEKPDLFFLIWEPLLYFFNPDTKSLFYEQALTNADNTDATDFINGLIELDNQRPEIALFHFNRIDDYVASYFIALCYFDLENFENAIKNNLLFVENFEETIKNSKVDNQSLESTDKYLLVKYNVHNDLAYCYNRIEDFSNAYGHYKEVLKIFNLEELYSFRHNESEDQNLFVLDLNNFLLAAEKVGQYSKGIEILNFAIEKYPHNNYYKELKQKFEQKVSNNSFADEIIRQVFKTKKPFNIEKFEATKLLAKEKILEDMIVEQIKYGYKVFGKDLEVYQDAKMYGRQYYLPTVNGILDLLLIERSSNTLYVVELKRNEAGIEVVEQVERYISGLGHLFIDRDIKGIICLHRPDTNLIELVKTKPNIELFTYQFSFNRLE